VKATIHFALKDPKLAAAVHEAVAEAN